MSGLEAPWDESSEPTGLFLQSPNHLEVIHPLFQSLVDAKHHRGCRPHAELMRSAMDQHPIFGPALQPGNAVTDLVVEDLSPAAGDGVEARIAQSLNRVADRKIAVLGNRQDF